MQIPWILIGSLSPAEIARALMPPKSNINGLALVVVRYPPLLPSPPLFDGNAHAPSANNSYITATDLVPRRKSGASPSSSSRVSSCTLDESLISWNFFNPFNVHAEGKLGRQSLFLLTFLETAKSPQPLYKGRYLLEMYNPYNACPNKCSHLKHSPK